MPDPKHERERPVGRSFEDYSRPLGAELIDRTAESDEAPHEGVYGRAASPGVHRNGVAERAKAIGVLRKLDELVHSYNPPPSSAAAVHRALELAAGRLGLSLREYDELVRGDEDLIALERQVLGDVIGRYRRTTRGQRTHQP